MSKSSNTSQFYVHPQEVWSVAECKKKVKHYARDGMGSRYSFPGYIGSWQPYGGQWGTTRYNGGCVHDGKWYDGEIRNLPVVPAGFKIVQHGDWGYRIIESGVDIC